jgi:hypothetical protein
MQIPSWLQQVLYFFITKKTKTKTKTKKQQRAKKPSYKFTNVMRHLLYQFFFLK